MEQTTTTAAAPERPKFLKVLCILSFIGAPLGLISGIMNYFTYSNLQKIGAAVDAAGGDKNMEKSLDAMSNLLGLDYKKIAMGYLIIGLLNLIILGGTFMMWNLKKMGFYLYTVGQIAILAVMFGYIGGMVGGFMGIVTAIFAIAFIIMYAVNLKQMK